MLKNQGTINQELDIRLLPVPRPKQVNPDLWEDLRGMTEKATKRLPRLIERIERAVGVTYPRVVAMPVGIMHPRFGVYFGGFNWMPDEDEEILIPVVWLPAPTLLYANDELLTSIMLYELFRYINDAIVISRAKWKKPEKLLLTIVSSKRAVRPLDRIGSKFEARVTQLANEWIDDEAMMGLFLRNRGRSDGMRLLREVINRKWVRRNSPVVGLSALIGTFTLIMREALRRKEVEALAYIDPAVKKRIS